MTDGVEEYSLIFEKLVPAPLQEVWNSWTTEEGIKTFFAPACRIDLRPGGAYEMYFDLEAAPGMRGGEGCRILALEKPILFSFTWNFPPDLPGLRNDRQSTHVVLRLFEETTNSTRVRLIQDGWGSSRDWEQGMSYFKRAWGDVVLPRLVQRFTEGPINWHEV